jgi:hypothetical protein
MDASSLVTVGLLFLVVIVIGMARIRKLRVVVQRMNDEDGNDPLKRWARGCYAILFGEASPDRRGEAWCRERLRDDWSIETGEKALATIERLSGVPKGRVAWDLVRVVVVARLAARAGYLSMQQAQAAVGRIQRRLQDRYPDWQAMATDYDADVEARGFGDWHLQRRLAAREIWRVVPFK